jgi:hypothetical protein
VKPLGINAFQSASGDPYAAFVTLLLHGDTAATVVDSSSYRRVSGSTGTPPTLYTANKKFGTACLAFNAGGTLTYPNSPLDYFGAGDFTIEAWIFPDNAGVGPFTIISRWNSTGAANSNQFIFYLDTLVPVLSVSVNGTAAITAQGPALPINQWTHVAVVRSANTLTVYTNGIAGTGVAVSGALFATETNLLMVGGYQGGSAGLMSGGIDDLRITKTARYTGNFSPPTAALPDPPAGVDPFSASVVTLLHGDGPSGKNNSVYLDSSPSAYTITSLGAQTQGAYSPYASGGGSMGCNGVSSPPDGVGVAGAGIALGAGDFTIELWFRYFNNASNSMLYDGRPASGNGAYPTIHLAMTGIQWYTNSAAQIQGPVPSLNVWHHVLVSRSAGQTRLFLDGVQQGATYADATNYLATASRPVIGSNGSLSGATLFGWISEVRVLVGIARQTANFTPPTAVQPPVAQSKLQLDFTNAGIVDSTRRNDYRTVGSTRLESAQSRFGGMSIVVPPAIPTGLRVLSAPDFIFGTGDFTVEFFVWLSNVESASGCTLFDGRTAATSACLTFYYGSNRLGWIMNGFARTTTGTVSNGQWYHLAVCRSGGQSRFFLDGVQQGATVADATNYTANTFTAIGDPSYSTGSATSCFIDELRVTKAARYVGSFVPPTAPFAAQLEKAPDHVTPHVELPGAGDPSRGYQARRLHRRAAGRWDLGHHPAHRDRHGRTRTGT